MRTPRAGARGVFFSPKNLFQTPKARKPGRFPGQGRFDIRKALKAEISWWRRGVCSAKTPSIPISSRDEDLLGRVQFADAIADAIARWKRKDSLVVGLYGDWGSGKSSIKNMVVERFRKNQTDSPEVVEFSPWRWSGEDHLIDAFFQDIGDALGRSDKSSTGKRAAKKWKAYAATFNLSYLDCGLP